MSFIETVKELGTVVLTAVKENPIIAIAAVGTGVVGYGGYRGVKYLCNRPSKQEAVVAVEAVAPTAEATATAIALAATAALLSMSRAEADSLDLLPEWNAALKAHLRAKKTA